MTISIGVLSFVSESALSIEAPHGGGLQVPQIGQGTGRHAFHLAEVIRHAMEADA
jgi:hypothetical protein